MDSQHLQIRWLIRRDLESVLRIEDACFEFIWNEEDFLCCLRQRNCIGMVTEHDHEIVGFAIYELHKNELRIINFAVRPDCQRQGVGTAMVNRLIEKASQNRRKLITLEVRETNLDAQRFFRSQEFRAVRILRNCYEETDEDAYVMQYRLDAEWELPVEAGNRITQYLLDDVE